MPRLDPQPPSAAELDAAERAARAAAPGMGGFSARVVTRAALVAAALVRQRQGLEQILAGCRPPEGSNADEWHLYLAENLDALPMVAVAIAEAIERAAAQAKAS